MIHLAGVSQSCLGGSCHECRILLCPRFRHSAESLIVRQARELVCS